MRFCRVMVFTVIAVLLPAIGAQADAITFVLTNSVQAGTPGSILMFSADITNTGSTTIFLTGDSISPSSAFLNVTDNGFSNNVPFSLDAGKSTGTVELFEVMIDPAASPGTYDMNFFDLIAGANPSNPDLIETQQFTVNVTSATTPEPASILLMASGLVIPLLRRRT